ncbi:MAG: hypothetical protein GF355_10850 [Candidatus Eisenbacteria bacterium]|nr:hypothetical protein [Candidatus Eisenbacteria bacterium]
MGRFGMGCAGVALLLMLGSAASETYIVKPDGTGDFPTIQAAIDAAVGGDVIELADGVFTGSGNRDLDYGGKAIRIASESGDARECVIDCQGNGRGFHFHSGEGPGSELADVTVRNGNAEAGGTIFCEQSSPSVVGCILTQSSAQGGGGIMCMESSPAFSRCSVTLNETSNHGGGYLGRDSSPAFEDCDFRGNRAPTDIGGGVSAAGTSSPTFLRCVFTGNMCGYKGGAMVVSEYCDAVVEDCTFSGNTAQYGAGITCAVFSEPIISNCTFHRNAAQGGSALECYWGANAAVERSIFAFSTQGNAVNLVDGAATLTCVNIYGNAGGDWVGPIADQYGVNGNISQDPLFCQAASIDVPLGIHSDSPCAPFSPPNADCDLIGAWPVSCGTLVELPRPEPPSASGSGERLELCLISGNPATGGSVLQYTIPEGAGAAPVCLRIIDPSGRIVRTLVGKAQGPGVHTVAWDGTGEHGRRAGPGIYLCRLCWRDRIETSRVALIR